MISKAGFDLLIRVSHRVAAGGRRQPSATIGAAIRVALTSEEAGMKLRLVALGVLVVAMGACGGGEGDTADRAGGNCPQ
jgi:hypothetical protein